MAQMHLPTNMTKHLLILGSSVAYGQGASTPTKKGWARKVARIAKDAGYDGKIENCALGGTTAGVWVHILSSLDDDADIMDSDPFFSDKEMRAMMENLRAMRDRSRRGEEVFAVLSLSLANEGLFALRPQVQNEFLSDMRLLCRLLGIVVAGDAKTGSAMGGPAWGDGLRLVLCGPYPNGDSRGGPHWDAMQLVRDTFKSWAGMSPGNNKGEDSGSGSGQEHRPCHGHPRLGFLDFLDSRVTRLERDFEGTWASQKLITDAAHPNDEGHGKMFEVFMDGWGKEEFCFGLE